MDMPSLLILTFLLQLLIHTINTVGVSTINELLWLLYNRLPLSTAKNASETARLRREVLRLKKELAGVSAQDEFTRWAKLRRQHDKAVEAHDKAAGDVKSTRANFDKAANVLRWLGTTGLRFLLQFWYSRKPMFWIPQGWVPSYIEWVLSFPRAPIGSISMQVWWIACASVTVLGSEAVVALYTLTQRHKNDVGSKKQPMAYEASSSAGGTAGEKKEL